MKPSSFQGIRKFGKNFSAIASILGTKTESHVRSFFVNYRRRYDLDLAYKVSKHSIKTALEGFVAKFASEHAFRNTRLSLAPQSKVMVATRTRQRCLLFSILFCAMFALHPK